MYTQHFLFILVPENGCVKKLDICLWTDRFQSPQTLLWEPANTEERSKHKAAKHRFKVSHPHLGFHDKMQVCALVKEMIKCWHFQFP